ncbi:MAG: bifunctional phosphoribosylaminoimidazolecarboxamide formyltransferase/IMP cyclohydrolase, partial [Acidimicrobiia bacterium]
MTLGVLVSGGGTNLQAILDAGLPVGLVLSDRPEAAALTRAAGAGIATVVVDRSSLLPDRAAFTEAVTRALQDHDVTLVAMAGFMTVLGSSIFDAFPGRVVNTHPSLLPSFRGATAVADALAAGVKVSGCTIHLAIPEVDAGPILAQEPVPVADDDTEETLHERIKVVERRLYPQVLRQLVATFAEGSPTSPSTLTGPVHAPAERTEVRRALISVSDKDGLIELAEGLVDLGVELIASGGTARSLLAEGVPVVAVESVTAAPEMLDGRVKTLHPRIHGGILADRSKPDHVEALASAGGHPIDLVVVNLYPFRASPSIETIDVGGLAMVRAAAKNSAWVGVVTDPATYPEILEELRSNGCTLGPATRARLAADAFALTASYDAAIASWLEGPSRLDKNSPGDGSSTDESPLPRLMVIALERDAVLRYGENPHQRAASYRIAGEAPPWISRLVQHSGKELSYVNQLDTAAAWQLAQGFAEPAAVVVKHANPCGVALGTDIASAYRRALECDPLSAFGGVVAVNRPIDEEAAEAIAAVFTEVLVAPSYTPAALGRLSARKALRVLEAIPPGRPGLEVRRVGGGFLVQEPDEVEGREEWKVVTRAAPTEAQWRDLEFAWRVCAAVGSNAIVLAKDAQAVGVGAGQQSRVHAAELASRKAGERARGGVCASDAFFPFRDG